MRRTALVFVVVVAILAATTFWLTRRTTDDASLETSVAVSEAMGNADTSGYARADRVVGFSFPRDHGPHPAFKTEWWYVTGNLDTEGAAKTPGRQPDASGRDVGFELTLFRIAIRPPTTPPVQLAGGTSESSGGSASSHGASKDGSPSNGSPSSRVPRSNWATDQIYMGHFAVSDVTNEVQYDAERFSRAAAGLAGAQADPFRVWLEDWEMATVRPEDPIDGAFPMRIRARGNEVAANLILTPAKPRVLQGDRGLSQKGEGIGNASYYYTYPRIATEGVIVIEEDTLDVSGLSWMDREWSTSALSDDQEGWDWFALQLDDGRDVMYYQLRNQDGSASRYTDGLIVGPGGETTRIDPGDAQLEVLDTYTTPDGSRDYPVEWRFRIPSEDLDLHIDAAFDDQELKVSVRYWEGAVTIQGATGTPPVRGHGYVEMTGYGEGAASPVAQ